MSEAQSLFGGNKIKDYERILTGAHRNPTPRLRTPAVVCHVGFWEPLSIKSEDEAEAIRNKRKSGIDAYLTSVWKTLKAKHTVLREFIPNLVGDDLLLLTSYLDENGARHAFNEAGSKHLSTGVQLVSFVFDWHGARATIRAEKRTEYVTLTLLIDLSPFMSPEKRDALANAKTGLGAVHRSLLRLEEITRIQSARASADYSEIYRSLYDDIWDRFYDEVLRPSQALEQDLGDIFADFRGLVLGKTEDGPVDAAFQHAFWRRDREDGQEEDGAPTQAPLPCASLLRQFWPLVSAKVGEVDFAKYEFTASCMLGGRALFVSALGAQPHSVARSQRFPLYYFVYSDTGSSWQLGRLIELMHNLGCERLASLVKFDQLRDVGYKLRGVEQEFQQARDLYLRRDSEIDTVGGDAEGRLNKLATDLSDHIRKIERRLRAINEVFGGDIEYRIERSQHYTRQFRDGLESLRIQRLEGYQPYDTFVERRLGPAFSYIDSLRTEYERMMKEKATLEQHRFAVQNRALMIATRNRNRDIGKLQNIADLALWGALIPYYLGAVFITHILGEDRPNAATATLQRASHHWLYIWVAAILVGSGWHLYRRLAAPRVSKLAWVFTSLWLCVAIAAAGSVYCEATSTRWPGLLTSLRSFVASPAVAPQAEPPRKR